MITVKNSKKYYITQNYAKDVKNIQKTLVYSETQMSVLR